MHTLYMHTWTHTCTPHIHPHGVQPCRYCHAHIYMCICIHTYNTHIITRTCNYYKCHNHYYYMYHGWPPTKIRDEGRTWNYNSNKSTPCVFLRDITLGGHNALVGGEEWICVETIITSSLLILAHELHKFSIPQHNQMFLHDRIYSILHTYPHLSRCLCTSFFLFWLYGFVLEAFKIICHCLRSLCAPWWCSRNHKTMYVHVHAHTTIHTLCVSKVYIYSFIPTWVVHGSVGPSSSRCATQGLDVYGARMARDAPLHHNGCLMESYDGLE